jgi:protein tyrosine phosphatase
MWDDHTVPTNSEVLVKFIRLIRAEYRSEQHGPMLVHCSAGVGRSGTFIALDRLLQQFDALSVDAHLDIFGTVLELRRCRDKMVQNQVAPFDLGQERSESSVLVAV